MTTGTDGYYCPFDHTHGTFPNEDALQAHLASNVHAAKARELAGWCATLVELMVGRGGTGRHCCQIASNHSCFNNRGELEDHYVRDHRASELASEVAGQIVAVMGNDGGQP